MSIPVDIQGVKSSPRPEIILQKGCDDGFITLAKFQGEYVTWQSNDWSKDDYYWGHYFGEDYFAAEKDFHKRG